MEDMELICLQIISNAGEARSESMAALAAAGTALGGTRGCI